MKTTGKLSLPAREKTLKERARERTVWKNVQTFRGLPQQAQQALQPVKESVSIQEELNRERLREIKLKHYTRIGSSLFFSILLAGQNIAVFWVIFRAFDLDRLQDLQLIFAALVGATLTETYFITKIIINFVFSTTDYSYERK